MPVPLRSVPAAPGPFLRRGRRPEARALAPRCHARAGSCSGRMRAQLCARRSAGPARKLRHGAAPPCTATCLRSVDMSVKALSHARHLYGFSPVWMRWWRRRAPCWVKVFPHCSQKYGRVSEKQGNCNQRSGRLAGLVWISAPKKSTQKAERMNAGIKLCT